MYVLSATSEKIELLNSHICDEKESSAGLQVELSGAQSIIADLSATKDKLSVEVDNLTVENTRIKEKISGLEESKLKLLEDQGILEEKLESSKLEKESKLAEANQLQSCLDERNKEIKFLWKEKEQVGARVASLES